MKTRKSDVEKIYKGNKAASVLMAASIGIKIVSLFIVMGVIRLYTMNQLTKERVILFGIAIVLCQLLKAGFYTFSLRIAHDAAYSSLVEIRLNIINHLKKLPISFFLKRKTGDLSNIINHDVEQVEVYLAHAYPEILETTLIPLLIFIGLLFVDWRLALAMISTIPIMIILTRLFKKFWGEQFGEYNKTIKRMSEDLVEYVRAISVIKAFSKDESKTKKVLGVMYDYTKWVRKMTLGVSIPMGVIALSVQGALIVLVVVASLLLSNNDITSNQFIISIILAGVFIGSFTKLSSLQHSRIVFGKTINNINTILGVDPQLRNTTNEAVSTTDIEFENVTFGYNQEEKVLKDVNLSFKKNSVNALVGSSGSGKSTTANLIMGFYSPQKGIVKIGGKNVENMDEKELGQLVSIVQQEVFLFNISIEDNIKIGNKDASRQEVMEAAKKAQLHDMIMELNDGYDTLVGEGGAKLSGGEKQRISIARMILKNAPIIILDESTSAIDPYNEYLIQKAIDNLSEDKTIIMIAHHLNTIVNADQIVVMNDGKIVGKGKHDQLVDNCYLYKEMLENQNKVDNWEIKEAI